MENLQNFPIILGVDFNTILNLIEKIKGVQQISKNMKDFKEWCEGHNIIDIPCCNGIHTWNNKWKDFAFIVEKLDRFF